MEIAEDQILNVSGARCAIRTYVLHKDVSVARVLESVQPTPPKFPPPPPPPRRSAASRDVSHGPSPPQVPPPDHLRRGHSHGPSPPQVPPPAHLMREGASRTSTGDTAQDFNNRCHSPLSGCRADMMYRTCCVVPHPRSDHANRGLTTH